MIRETLTFATEQDWLNARKNDVTSTEAAGLFDAGAYANSRTFYELFNVKGGLLPPAEFNENDRTKWGNRLEAAIAHGIADDYGLIVEPFKCYMRIPELRMGSSFDFKIVGIVEDALFPGDNEIREMFREHGTGIMEVKNVDSIQFKRNWIDDGETIEATPQIEFQSQHQMEVADINWSLISPLVGGNTPKVVIRQRDLEVGEMIRAKVAELWKRIAAGNPPDPDFTKDSGVISKLYVDNNGTEIDLSDNMRLIELCSLYKQHGEAEKQAKSNKDAAKAEILTIIQYAKTAYAGMYKVSAGTNKESYRCYNREASERWTISKSIIPAGQVEATVPPFRNLRISGEAA